MMQKKLFRHISAADEVVLDQVIGLSMSEPFRLKISVVWWMKLILTIPFTAISILAIVQVFQNVKDAFIGLMLFGSMAVIGWANALSNILITEKDVTVTVFYGRFRIYWDEVQKISFGYLNSTTAKYPLVALIGNDKRIVLSLSYMMSDQEKMLSCFNEQIEKRNLLVENGATFPITHQNARVW